MYRLLVGALTALAMTLAPGGATASVASSTQPSERPAAISSPRPAAPERVAGPNRYATAAQIVAQWPVGVATAYVVNGEDYPDALAAAARAGVDQAPVVPVRPASVPAESAAALRHLRPARLVVVGGPTAVSPAVLDQLRGHATSGTVQRVAGPSRYATAAAVASRYPAGQRTVYLASGENFPDALAGAALAGHQRAPLLLTRHGQLDAVTRAELSRLAAREVVVLGGPTVVSESVAREARRLTTGDSVRRLSGDTRYGTAAVVAAQFPRTVTPAYVASGQSFPDALVGAALAARQGVPMILTPPDRVHRGTAQALTHQQSESMYVLGGSSVVYSSTMEDLGRYLHVGSGAAPTAEVFTPLASAADIRWSGQTWHVKESTSAGPGPNRWHHSSVELGDQGSLRLRVKQNARGQWECAEVVRAGRTGYGTFTFRTSSSVIPVDDRSVLGLFTYQHATPAEGYEEIDIEYARWGRAGVGPGSLSVHKPQPHWYREFPLTHTGPMTHSFLWAPGYVRWTISRDDTGAVLHQRELWGDEVPRYVDARMILNLWLLDGTPPESGAPFEVTLSAASWTPLPAGFTAPRDPGPARTATLTDAFSGTLDTARWPGARQYGSPTVVADRLRMPFGPGYHGVQSAPDYALASSSVTVEQLRPATVHGQSESEVAFVRDDAHSVHVYARGRTTGQVRIRTGGVDRDLAFSYSPTKHRWVRIRHSGSTLSFEGSTDGRTWSRLVSPQPAPSWVASAVGHVKLGAGNWQVTDSGRAVDFDNLNLAVG